MWARVKRIFSGLRALEFAEIRGRQADRPHVQRRHGVGPRQSSVTHAQVGDTQAESTGTHAKSGGTHAASGGTHAESGGTQAGSTVTHTELRVTHAESTVNRSAGRRGGPVRQGGQTPEVRNDDQKAKG